MAVMTAVYNGEERTTAAVWERPMRPVLIVDESTDTLEMYKVGHRRGEAGAEPQRAALEAMIRGTYREMPGLSLYLDQAARLFGLRELTCRIVLDDLLRAGVLRRSADGQYTTSEATR